MLGTTGAFFNRVISRFQSSLAPILEQKQEPKPALNHAPAVTVPSPVISDAPPAPALPRPGKQGRAITTGTGAIDTPPQTSTTKTKDPVRDAILLSLEQELLTLLSQTSYVLVRVKRLPTTAPSGVGPDRVGNTGANRRTAPRPERAATELPVQRPFGRITMGRETAQNIERRARGLLLENNLTSHHQSRIERILQSSGDLLCALQAARYAWQMALLLPQEGHSGQSALPRLKRVTESAIEMSSQVALAIEGREGATGAVAEQYRAFLTVKEETSIHFSRWRENGILSQTARRLVRAALWSITVAAESMAKVAARFALPLETSREVNQVHEKYKHLDRGDDLLAPLRRR